MRYAASAICDRQNRSSRSRTCEIERNAQRRKKVSRTNDSKDADRDRALALTSSRLGTTSFNTCRTVGRSELMVSTLESERPPELCLSYRLAWFRVRAISTIQPRANDVRAYETRSRVITSISDATPVPFPSPFLMLILMSPVRALRMEPK